MYCNKCGKYNSKNSNYCQFCDYKFEVINSGEISTDKDSSDHQQENIKSSVPKKSSIWKKAGSVLIAISAYALARYSGQGLSILFVIIAWLIGVWITNHILKKSETSKFFSIVAWSNLLSWLSPILGFLTAGSTFILASKTNKKRYKFLWIFATLLATINLLSYPYFNTNTTNSSIKNSEKTTQKVSNNKDINNAQSVVSLYCDNDKGGSGTILTNDGTILTNNHVIDGSTSCLVTLPDPQTGSPIAIYNAQPYIVPNLSSIYDIALVQITGSYVDSNRKIWGVYPTTFPIYTKPNTCTDNIPKLGDPITIYGYPVTSGDYNLTITQGIISNFSDNGNILTSAQVDSGNSGGLAVNTKTGCMIGIPSAVSEGNYQNLGVIIPMSVIADFLEKAKSQGMNLQPPSTSISPQDQNTQASGN